jgi:hypothetical protein
MTPTDTAGGEIVIHPEGPKVIGGPPSDSGGCAQ